MNDENITGFDRNELLSILQENDYHSTEISDSEDESRSKLPGGKNFIHAYDHPWRSEMVNIFPHILYNSAINTNRLYFILNLEIVEVAPS
jgi:hypothetical protein